MKSLIALAIFFIALEIVSSRHFRRFRDFRGNFISLNNVAASNSCARAENNGVGGNANAVANSASTNVNNINQSTN
jgi:hypothetical protein